MNDVQEQQKNLYFVVDDFCHQLRAIIMLMLRHKPTTNAGIESKSFLTLELLISLFSKHTPKSPLKRGLQAAVNHLPMKRISTNASIFRCYSKMLMVFICIIFTPARGAPRLE